MLSFWSWCPPTTAAAAKHYGAGQAAEARVAPWVCYSGWQAKMAAQLLLIAPGRRS